MTETNEPKVTQDRGFKALFEAFGLDAVAFFLPEMVTIRGAPVSVTLLQQEVIANVLGDHSLFLDAALLTTWADGGSTLILLVEHHSEARKVDPPRLAKYVASLQVRHREAEVYPCVLVTDRSATQVPDRWSSTAAGMEVMTLRWKVIRVREGDLDRLRSAKNKIAAILVTLAFRDAIDAGVRAVEAMRAAGYTPAQIHRFLPLVLRLARIQDVDQPRFQHRLLEEVPEMRTFIDEIADESLAKGKAAGFAEGELAVILHLVTKGRLPLDAARGEIADLVAACTITREQADAALAKLG